MTGLAYAINRAYHAWVRTQPQLVLDLWDERDGLDETHGFECRGLRLVEPAVTSPYPCGGLNKGAEPGHDHSYGELTQTPVVAPPAPAGSSAPPQHNGPRPHDLDGMRDRGRRRSS